MTQMAGQTISPNQKILDSDSDAGCLPEVCVLSQRGRHHHRDKREAENQRKMRTPSPSSTQTATGCVRHRPPGSTIWGPPSTSLWCSEEQQSLHLHPTNLRQGEGGGAHFDCPEVTGEQQDDRHHAADEATAEDLTQQVGEDGGDSEEEVEEGGHGVPVGRSKEARLSRKWHSNRNNAEDGGHDQLWWTTTNYFRRKCTKRNVLTVIIPNLGLWPFPRVFLCVKQSHVFIVGVLWGQEGDIRPEVH